MTTPGRSAARRRDGARAQRIELQATLFGAVLRFVDGSAAPPTWELSMDDVAWLRDACDEALRLKENTESGK